ncbi:MAG: EamA family transporter [Sphingomonas sp.]|jgi:inner membrane transporter RhtA|uniref:EamA family transporter n=1 Tax=Sphingomonas sp. TaxID=28214 RepID=UPI00356680DD
MANSASRPPVDPGHRFDSDSIHRARAAANLLACFRRAGKARPTDAPTIGVAPYLYFLVSGIFHYLGPAFATLLFAVIAPLGVAWLRITVAAIIFAAWRRPWRKLGGMTRRDWQLTGALGLTLSAMNICFYLAIARLPLATVGAIEFLGPIAVAATGLRDRRNWLALLIAAVGVYLLTGVRFSGERLGYLFAFANCALFMLYLVLGHRAAADGSAAGIDRVAAAMVVAAIAATPLCLGPSLPALASPILILAGVGVAVSSSVIPYVTDQLAMARLPRNSFALMLALLPAMAAVIGVLILGQKLWPSEFSGIAMIAAGVALHRPARPVAGPAT